MVPLLPCGSNANHLRWPFSRLTLHRVLEVSEGFAIYAAGEDDSRTDRFVVKMMLGDDGFKTAFMKDLRWESKACVKHLRPLQGSIVPRYYGLWKMDGGRYCEVMEYCGCPINEVGLVMLRSDNYPIPASSSAPSFEKLDTPVLV